MSTDLTFITNENDKRLKDRNGNPLKVLATLQTHIPERLLESHYAEYNPQSFGRREVILSLYIRGE